MVLPRDKIDVELVRELVHSLITMVVRSRDNEKEREDRRSSAVVASLIDFDTSSSKDREEREKSIIAVHFVYSCDYVLELGVTHVMRVRGVCEKRRKKNPYRISQARD